MPKLSVVIITYNEEKNIARCLESVKEIADDIVIVDSFSTDKTPEICEQHKIRFYQHNWMGYSATKNYANTLALHDWILSLDADEALSEKLCETILKYKQKDEPIYGEFNRLTNYCGQWIRHCGWYPDKKLRLFDRTKTQWEGIIHEKLIVKEKVEPLFLEGDCFHYSYYTIADHIKQVNYFTEVAAKALFREGRKASLINILVKPIVKFVKDYLLKTGFLDGYYGFVICAISAHATFLKYVILRQFRDEPETSV